jgi:hypothetical protein
LVAVSYDAAEELEAWERSLRLLVEEVVPSCRTSLDASRSGPRLEAAG